MYLRGRKSFPEPRRILLIQLRRIGDTLLGTPALRALAVHFPRAKIDFVVESPADEVLWSHPQVTRLLVAPRRKGFRAWLEFIRELRQESYDWTIDFLSNPRSAQYAFLSSARIRVGLSRFGRRYAYTHLAVEESADREAYAVDLRLSILERMGVPPSGRQLDIFCDRQAPEEMTRVTSLLAGLDPEKPLAAVAVGSANDAKRYPADLCAELIGQLRQRGLSVVLTAGPGESRFADEILKQLDAAVHYLTDARVPTLTALYRHAAIYVGPDSAPKHVAVACGIPTVTIFGPGCPSNWNDPQRKESVVLAAPCDVRPHCVEAECAKQRCLRKITPAQITEAVMDLLGNPDQ